MQLHLINTIQGLLLATLATAAAATQFTSINGLLCIRSEFLENHVEARSESDCGLLCDDNRRRCQAFSMADGWCQLFVFDACSKNVRDCNCTRRAQVFVRQQPGLSPGALCPAGYANYTYTCGTKYKVFLGIKDWTLAKAAIDAESGLVIMADLTDLSEIAFVKVLMQAASWTYLFVGGRQLPGSAEPAGGWVWASCNSTIDAGVWRAGEPSNTGGTEHYGLIDTIGLLDIGEYVSTVSGSLAKCLSPFD